MFKDINSEMAVKVWTLGAEEIGMPLMLDKHYAESVMVTGTFGQAAVVVQGSNAPKPDGEFFFLTDNHGSPLAFKSSGLKSVSEECIYVRPIVDGGDETTEVTVTLLIEK